MIWLSDSSLISSVNIPPLILSVPATLASNMPGMFPPGAFTLTVPYAWNFVDCLPEDICMSEFLISFSSLVSSYLPNETIPGHLI